jgi:hypothetical protein
MAKEKIPMKDFDPSSLPRNRKKQFFDSLKNEWRLFFSVSLLLAIFILPLFCDYLVFSLLVGGAYSSHADDNQIFSLVFYGALIAVPCIMIFYLGLAGALNIAKKLGYSEIQIATPSFFYGIKEIWKKALIQGLIVGVSAFIAIVGCLYLLLFYNIHPVWVGILMGVDILQFIVFTMASIFTLTQSFVYSNKAVAEYKNAFLMTIAHFPMNFVFFLIGPGLFIGLFIISDVTAYIAFGIAIFFSFPFIYIWELRALVIFDKMINQYHYPEHLKKGLYVPKNKED